eukprot:685666-Rhodomonas_salina.7
MSPGTGGTYVSTAKGVASENAEDNMGTIPEVAAPLRYDPSTSTTIWYNHAIPQYQPRAQQACLVQPHVTLYRASLQHNRPLRRYWTSRSKRVGCSGVHLRVQGSSSPLYRFFQHLVVAHAMSVPRMA